MLTRYPKYIKRLTVSVGGVQHTYCRECADKQYLDTVAKIIEVNSSQSCEACGGK